MDVMLVSTSVQMLSHSWDTSFRLVQVLNYRCSFCVSTDTVQQVGHEFPCQYKNWITGKTLVSVSVQIQNNRRDISFPVSTTLSHRWDIRFHVSTNTEPQVRPQFPGQYKKWTIGETLDSTSVQILNHRWDISFHISTNTEPQVRSVQILNHRWDISFHFRTNTETQVGH